MRRWNLPPGKGLLLSMSSTRRCPQPKTQRRRGARRLLPPPRRAHPRTMPPTPTRHMLTYRSGQSPTCATQSFASSCAPPFMAARSPLCQGWRRCQLPWRNFREFAEQNAEARSKEGAVSGAAAVKLSTFEFGCFDLSGTVDGVLWKIFSEVGFAQRKAVALVSETEWRHAVTNLAVFADFEAIIIGTSVESHSDAEAALSHPSLPPRLAGSRVSLVDEFASKENVETTSSRA